MIMKIGKEEVKQFYKESKKEGLTFCENTEYYGYIKNNELIGFTGILFYKNKCIFKNHYVLKKHRRRGIFKDMFKFSIKLTKGMIIEATCTEMSIDLYLKNGFKIIKEYKKYKKVQIENI